MDDHELDWKLVILQQLRIRNQKESGSFTDLFSSHGKLQEQVESLGRKITYLQFQNNELEKQLSDIDKEVAKGGGSGGGGASSAQLARLTKKVEELQSKIVSKTEELMDVQKKWISATDKLRSSEDVIKKKDDRIKELVDSNRKNEEKIEDLEKQISTSVKTNQELIDEHTALHTAFNSQQDKLRQTQSENDGLRKQLIKIKAKDADRLNEENEAFRRKREEQLKEELRRASEDKGESARRGSTPKEDKRRRESSSSVKGSEETAPGPSICPASNLISFDAHDNEVSALCFSDNGHYMATGGADKVVKIWSWRSSQEKMESKCVLHGNTASIMSVQFDQHSRMVLAASNDHSAKIWSISDQRLKHTLTGHSNKVLAAKFLDDNNKVVTGSHDRTLKIWDLQHHTCSRTLFAGSSCNDVVAGRGMGNQVISGHFDKRIRFWDLRTSTANEIALQGKVTSLDHYPARYLLLCCSRDDTLRLIDLRQNSITATFSAGGFHVSVDWTRACFSPDGQYVAAGSNDGTLFVWETFTGKIKSKKEHSKEIVSCAWHPKGQLFASADRNKKVVLWKR